MFTTLVFYREPENPDEFRSLYPAHLDIARRLPLIKGAESYLADKGNAVEAWWVTALHWESRTDMEAAFASEVGRELGADIARLGASPAFSLSLEALDL
jgi:hypothetical protein